MSELSRLSLAEVDGFLRQEFPQLFIQGEMFSISEIGDGSCRQ